MDLHVQNNRRSLSNKNNLYWNIESVLNVQLLDYYIGISENLLYRRKIWFFWTGPCHCSKMNSDVSPAFIQGILRKQFLVIQFLSKTRSVKQPWREPNCYWNHFVLETINCERCWWNILGQHIRVWCWKFCVQINN